MRLGYAYEKFNLVLKEMASSPQSIKDRIYNAYFHFHALKSDDLPQSSRQKYNKLMTKLTSVPAEENEGGVRASLNAMPDNQAEDLARIIVDLHDEIKIANWGMK